MPGELLSRVVTIVGASARAAAYSAVRAGFSVQAADMFADVDLRRVCVAHRVTDYPTGLATAITGAHTGGWMYAGGLESHPLLVERWARVRPLWGNRADVLRRVRQPHLVANVLRRAGLRAPAVRLDPPTPIGDGKWLCKGLRSCGGSQVAVWDGNLPAGLDARDCYFQQFVDGPSCSAVYVAARGDAALLGITQQLIGARWCGAQGFRYCGSVGPLEVSHAITDQFIAIGKALAKEFDLVGLFGVDAIFNSIGVWPVEVNPRYTASIEVIERASEIRAIELHVNACQQGQLPTARSGTAQGQAAKAVLFASRRLVVPKSVSSLSDQPSQSRWPAMADIPAPGTVIEPGWPILTVLAAANSQREALEALQRQATVVRATLGETTD